MAFNLNRTASDDEEKKGSDSTPEKGQGHREFSDAIKLMGGPALLDILQSIIPMLSVLGPGMSPIMPGGAPASGMGMGLDPMTGRVPGMGKGKGKDEIKPMKSVEIKAPDDAIPSLSRKLQETMGEDEDGDCGCPEEFDAPMGLIEDVAENTPDGEDAVMDTFKQEMGGPKTVFKVLKLGKPKQVEAALNEMIDTLKEVRAFERAKLARLAFSDLHAGKLQSADLRLANIARDSGGAELDKISSARELIAHALQGEVRLAETAAFRVRQVFAGLLPNRENVKTAYTMLNTQQGEGFMMCPKAVGNYGFAMPIEVSKCRENCIDSEVHRDGTVGCRLAHWLKTSADSMKYLQERLEGSRIEHGLNPQTLNIPEGKRTNGVKDPESTETRLEKVREGLPKEECRETQLDGKFNLWRHQGEAGQKRLQDEKSKGVGSRMQDLERSASKMHALDPNCGENLTQQVENIHRDEPNDETLSQILDGEHESNCEGAEFDVIESRLKARHMNKGK